MSERARQFMPFSALKGFEEALKEKEEIIVPKVSLSNDQLELLEYKIKEIKVNTIITVIFYNDHNYISKEGVVTKIDFINKYLVIVKTKILFENIKDIKL